MVPFRRKTSTTYSTEKKTQLVIGVTLEGKILFKLILPKDINRPNWSFLSILIKLWFLFKILRSFSKYLIVLLSIDSDFSYKMRYCLKFYLNWHWNFEWWNLEMLVFYWLNLKVLNFTFHSSCASWGRITFNISCKSWNQC